MSRFERRQSHLPRPAKAPKCIVVSIWICEACNIVGLVYTLLLFPKHPITFFLFKEPFLVECKYP